MEARALVVSFVGIFTCTAISSYANTVAFTSVEHVKIPSELVKYAGLTPARGKRDGWTPLGTTDSIAW